METFRERILSQLASEDNGDETDARPTIHMLARVLAGKVPRSTIYHYLSKPKRGRPPPQTSTKVLEAIIRAMGGVPDIYPLGYRPKDLKGRWMTDINLAKRDAREAKRSEKRREP